jgi:predicted esterase
VSNYLSAFLAHDPGSQMNTKVEKTLLIHSHFQVHALVFLPPTINPKNAWAVFTHGYTADKGDVLNWATRLAEAHIPSLIFDLPGHYLGSFEEAPSFDLFTAHAHELFKLGFDQLDIFIERHHGKSRAEKLILGGHSLGALLAIKSLSLFSDQSKLAIGVGIGNPQHVTTHLFDTIFYQKTLNIRRQLVSPTLDSDLMFPWIRSERNNLTVTNERIHLITGIDDAVVGAGGMKAYGDHLISQGASVTMEEPSKLPHHEPGLAASHLFSFLKREIGL